MAEKYPEGSVMLEKSNKGEWRVSQVLDGEGDWTEIDTYTTEADARESYLECINESIPDVWERVEIWKPEDE